MSKDMSWSTRADRQSARHAASAGEPAQRPAVNTRRERRWRYASAIQATRALNALRVQSPEPEVS
jgi:hypothetical protein